MKEMLHHKRLSLKRDIIAWLAISLFSLCPLSIGSPNKPLYLNRSLLSSKDLGTLDWVQATAVAPWTPRQFHGALAFDNKIWVLGGRDQDYPFSHSNDVWYSTDGIQWTQAIDEAPWAIGLFNVREAFASVVFDNKMWVIGGGNSTDLLNDVWYSSDGVNWVQVTDHAQWRARINLQGLVFDNKIWIIGGDRSMPIFNDVWYSSDGVNWTQATDNAEWGILDGYSTVAFHDRMWVIGGYNHTYGSLVGSVWSSTDGSHWTYEGDCGPRSDQTSVAAGGGIWLMGGNYWGDWTNSVWVSSNGAYWDPVDCGSHWEPKIRHASVAFNGKIWVLGGVDINAYELVNDVWYAEVFNAHFSGAPMTDTAPLTVQFTDESISVLETITSWLWDFGDGTTSTEQNPAHTYALRGLYDVSLTVTSASNTDTETKTGYIHVTDAEHPYHTADINQDHKISLSELLRVIQFYNLDGLHCVSGTEDGYAPGPSDKGLLPLVSKPDLSRRSETKPDLSPDKGLPPLAPGVDLAPDKGLLPLAPGVDLSPDKGLPPSVRTWEGEAPLSRQTKHARNTFPRPSYATPSSFPRRRESRPSLSFSCSHSSRAVRHSCRFRYSHEGGNPEKKYSESWIPACAGMTMCCENQVEKYSESWIPACAGMTALYGTKADCALHASDYYPPDWRISMSELLRAIQLFRSPGYHPCIAGEDGFCVD